MRKYIILILIIITSINLNAQITFLTVPNSDQYKRKGLTKLNYYVNQSYPHFSLTIIDNSFLTGDVIYITFNKSDFGESQVFSNSYTITRNGYLNTPDINISSWESSVYSITIFNSRIMRTIPSDYCYLVYEKTKSFVIDGQVFQINYVDDFFKYPETGSLFLSTSDANKLKNSYLNYIEKAIRWSWNYQIKQWKIGGIIKPLTKDVYSININCTYDTLNPKFSFLYKNQDYIGPTSSTLDSTRTIWLPVNLKRGMGFTGKFDDSTLFNEVIGHEFFHGLQFSVMKCSALLAANLTKERATTEFDRRKWLIEGQARFFETVMMDSSIRNGKNAAYVMNSMEQDYSSDCKQFLTRKINNVITQITKQQYV